MNAAELLDRAMSEDDFLTAVLDLARLTGWMVHHCRPAQVRDGRWVTPIQGDAGFPDLILARPGRLIAAELKSARGRVTGGQAEWLDVLAAVGGPVEVRVWRPADWASGAIRAVLAGR